jgi:hypothetical protein
MENEMTKTEYDLTSTSAVTFLLVGLGLGSFLTVVFGPRTKLEGRSEGIGRSWSPSGLQPEAAQVRM